MTGEPHPTFYVPGATAAFLDYRGAERPQRPYIRLYLQTADDLVTAADANDITGDWHKVGQVIREVERGLSEQYVPTRRQVPRTMFAEWDLTPR